MGERGLDVNTKKKGEGAEQRSSPEGEKKEKKRPRGRVVQKEGGKESRRHGRLRKDKGGKRKKD